MKLVIEIDEEVYTDIKARFDTEVDEGYLIPFSRAIANGTPLPKVLEDIKAKIKALPNVYPFYDHIDRYVKEEDVLAIIEADKDGE